MTERFLTVNDIDQIVTVEEKVFSDGWNKDQLVSSFNSGRFFGIGYFDNEKLVSFVTFSLSIDFADIEDICTLSAYQRKGLAKNLIIKVIDFTKKKGIKELLLEVREKNVSAKNLYLSLGFSQITVRKKYYADGEDALIFRKEI